jgi:hypothetical protein
MSRVTVIAALAVAVAGFAGPALAQGTGCGDIQKTLLERKELISKANSSSNSKKGSKLTAAEACSLFGRLVTNGSSGLKWIEANKEWCSIPDSFAEGFKADHAKVSSLRTKICGIASQQAAMEKKARQQAEAGGSGGGGLLGGPGLTGSYKVPQGAL